MKARTRSPGVGGMSLAEIMAAQSAIQFPHQPIRRKRRRARERRARAAPPASSDIVKFTRQMLAMNSRINLAVREYLVPALRRLEGEFFQDMDYADELQAILDRIRFEHVDLAQQHAALIASDMTSTVNTRNRERFYSSVEASIGINLAAVVDESALLPVLKLKTLENVNLIKTIPADYFAKIQTMVLENVVQGRTSAKSMIEELRELGAKSDARARFIARDQTAKLTASLNQERNMALGIEEYVWRTSEDERVRDTHRVKNGRVYRWDSPPIDTGHPGQDFQCRCVARPLIKL